MNGFLMQTLSKKKLMCFSLSLIAAACQSNAFANDSPYHFRPLAPRIIIEGTATSGVIGNAEGLFPIYGNLDRLLYGDMSASYDNHNAFLVSPGVGTRLTKNNVILGAYLFGDFNQTQSRSEFFVFNPGIEWISTRWDAHLNGYFPGTHRRQVKNLGYPSDSGNMSFTQFTGHSQIDQQLIQYTVVGNGVDGEVGYSVNIHGMRARLFGGGYHYTSSNVSNINGVQAGFEYPISGRLTAVVAASHDNVFQTAGALTFRLSLGKTNAPISENIEDRLEDMIPRHLGAINTAAGIPSQKSVRSTGSVKTIQNGNLYFFRQGISNLGSVDYSQCTFENPCVGINQNVINSINQLTPNANLLFSPGNYDFAPTFAANSILNIPANFSMYGKNADYITQASGANRAVILDALQLNGSNVVDSLQIENSTVMASNIFGSSVTGISIPSTANGNILLNNLNVNVTGNGQKSTAVSSSSSNTALTITNSTLTSNATDVATGFIAFGNNKIDLLNSTFNSTSTGAQSFDIESIGDATITLNSSLVNSNGINGNSTIYGVYISGATKMSINDSTILAAQNGTGTGGGAGINNLGTSSEITVNRSTVTVNSNKSNGMAGVQQILGGTTTINDSAISVNNTATTPSITSAINLVANTTGTLTVNRSQLSSQANTTGQLIGINNQSLTTGNIVINDSEISAINAGSSTIGLRAINNGHISLNGNSTLTSTSSTGNAFGTTISQTANIDIANATFIVNSRDASAYAGTATGTGAINFTGANITMTSLLDGAFKLAGNVNKDATTVCTINGVAC